MARNSHADTFNLVPLCLSVLGTTFHTEFLLVTQLWNVHFLDEKDVVTAALPLFCLTSAPPPPL